jgi:TIR domain
MAEELGASADRPKVFISYSRNDGKALAEELVPGLELAGFEPFLDTHDIEKGVDWEERLGGLILKADAIVFVITPASVRSQRCQWEVECATGLAKRVIPVQWIEVAESEVPERLRRLNYTIFSAGQSFTRPLSELVSALRQDVEWVRTHTMIGEQAARWKALGAARHADDLLLRGSQLEYARAWLKRRSANAPAVTEIQHTFIAASGAAEDARVNAEKQRLAEREQFVSEADLSKKRRNYIRIVFDALFRPSNIAPLIRFNDRRSLWSAILFWVVMSTINVSLNSVVTSVAGIDLSLGGWQTPESANRWLKMLFTWFNIIQANAVLTALYSVLIIVALSFFWYAGIRCLVPGSKLPFLGFVQCTAYPQAAIGFLGLPFTIAIAILAGDMYAKEFNFAAVLAKYPQLANRPDIVAACSPTESLQCRGLLLLELHSRLFIAQMIFAYVIGAWTLLNESTVIKAVTGLRRRRTLGGLLIAGLLALVLFVLAILAIVVIQTSVTR